MVAKSQCDAVGEVGLNIDDEELTLGERFFGCSRFQCFCCINFCCICCSFL